MAMRLDASTAGQFAQRIQSLAPDSRATWGKMSVDQMLWHVNKALGLSLGHETVGPGSLPLPAPVLKFLALRLPWMKGAPTHPDFVAKATHDFAAERARLLSLIDEVVAKPMSHDWPRHPAFGKMTGFEATQLMAKHIDHHLRQFGA